MNVNEMNNIELAEAMKNHVVHRGGAFKDDDGNVICKNGAWEMMLEASKRLIELEE